MFLYCAKSTTVNGDEHASSELVLARLHNDQASNSFDI
jgi:hypothetical protein